MPSASSKSSQQAAAASGPAVNMAEVLAEPLKGAVSVLDKKMRNLEKRKGKLLEYQKKQAAGAELNEEQRKAASELILVENSLKTVEDMRKNMSSMEQEYAKQSKRESKRAKMEQDRVVEARALDVVQGVIQIQAVLGNLTEEARADFLAGANQACELSDEEMGKLDKLFELCNTYEERTGKLSDQVAAHANHLLAIVGAKEDEAFDGTSYADLMSIMKRVVESAYFEKEVVEAAVEEEEEAEDEVIEDGEEAEVEVEAELEVVEDAVEAISEAISEVEVDDALEMAVEKTEEMDVNFEVVSEVNHHAAMMPQEVDSFNHMHSNGIGGGVDLPPEVEQKDEGEESIDFMGDSEVEMRFDQPAPTAPVDFEQEPVQQPAAVVVETFAAPEPVCPPPVAVQVAVEENPTLNPRIPEFVPRASSIEEPTTNGWQEAPSGHGGWQTAPAAEAGWTNVERSNPDPHGWRGRGRGGRPYRGRGSGGEYRGRGSGEYRGRGGRGGNYEAGERREGGYSDGGYRGGRGGGYRGGRGREDGGSSENRGGFRGGYRGSGGNRGGDGGNRGGDGGNRGGNRGGYRGDNRRGGETNNYTNRPQQQQPQQ